MLKKTKRSLLIFSEIIIMNITDKDIELYAERQSSSRIDQLLKQLEQETNESIPMPQMLSGAMQGQLLSMISQLARPSKILEIGTYTGYSAICLAQGLTDNGELHTIDTNADLYEMARRYFNLSGLSKQIIQHLDKAVDVIPQLDYQWDIVFIDADKRNYDLYYDMVFPNLKVGGLIIADNVLWKGKVLDKQTKDKRAIALDAFNKKIKADHRVENLILPIRDGLHIVKKLK